MFRKLSRVASCGGIISFLAIVFVAIMVVAAPSQAGITAGGNVTPNPAATTLSDYLRVGDTSNGSLAIDGGSTVNDYRVTLGSSATATGSVTVTGVNSTLRSADFMFIGFHGGGQAIISNGGLAVCTGTGAGVVTSYFQGVSSSVMVTNGGQWTCPGMFSVGYGGQSTMTVNLGSVVTSGGLSAGYLSGANGVVNIDGGATRWNGAVGVNSRLDIAYGGVGSVSITSGAKALGFLDSTIGYQSTGDGKLLISGVGSALEVTTNFYLGVNGKGTLSMVDGAMCSIGNLYLASNAGSRGELVFTLGSNGPGKITVLQDINLNTQGQTALTLSADAGYVFSSGQSFDVLDWNRTLYGTFDSLSLPSLRDGLAWDSSKLYTQGSVSVVPEPSTMAMLLIAALVASPRRARGNAWCRAQ